MQGSKSCPKCRSTDIVRIPGKHYGFGAGNIITVGFSYLSAVKVTGISVPLAASAKSGSTRRTILPSSRRNMLPDAHPKRRQALDT